MKRPASAVTEIRWQHCKNVSPYLLPAFGLVVPVGEPEADIVEVSAPRYDGERAWALGPQALPPGAEGVCTRDWPSLVLYNPAATPAAGEAWGVKALSCYAEKGYEGFVVAGSPRDGLVLLDTPGDLDRLVRVVSNTPNASGYYDAFLQRWDKATGKFVDAQPVWVMDPNA